jgi:hypothetical protein
MPIASGKGKKKTYGDVLVFSAALDTASAQNPSNYHVTQTIKKKTKTVRVVSATYSAATHAVTLSFGNKKPGKGLQVAVSGLLDARGAAVKTITIVL